MTSTTAIDRSQYLTFSVAEEEYGVSVLSVREILEYGVITRVPRAPAHIRGVMNLRGRVVPLVDLAVRFGLPPSPPTPRTCVVVVEAEVRGERTIMGLVADAVTQVLELGAQDIEPPPPFGVAGDAAFLSGMGRAGGRFVLLLDIERVLSAAAVPVAAPVASTSTASPQGARPTSFLSRTAAAAAVALWLLFAFVPRVAAQDGPIQDNSFLIEEAYNQPRGIVQHISTFSKPNGSSDWAYSFTQEWPLPDVKHQVSFTLPVQRLNAFPGINTGVGDLAFNYRYQALGAKGGPIAFSPRITLVAPTGQSSHGLGSGGTGLQFNLPLSVTLGSRFVTHTNAGFTRTFSARDSSGEKASTNGFFLGQSVVWLSSQRVNFLLETLWSRSGAVKGPGQTESSDTFYVSPGIRWSHDFKNGLQIVPGVAFPIGVGPSRGQHSVFLYLSFEHPFKAIH